MIGRMIAYRDATLADGPALDAMARQIWFETFGHSAPAADIQAYLDKAYGSNGALLRDLADPAIRFHLAVEGDCIVGYAKLTEPWVVEAASLAGALQLSQLYVVADRHGHGIAQGLMDWTIATARTRRAPALFLTVWEENARARKFYERYGFVHVGDYAFHVGAQVDRDEVMRLSL
jgi:GNAT superfamily N-acetyltransferase